MEDIAALKETLATASRILANEDLAQGFGHISVRLKGTDRFLVPRQMSPALVQPQDILTINLAGEQIEGKGEPNSETWIHTCIYRVRPDVNSVSHFHSFYVKLLGVVGQPIQPIINTAVRFADGVPIYTDPTLIDTEERGTNAAKMLGQHSAIMLRAHGATVVAEELRAAVASSLALEDSAKMQVWSNFVGKPILLNAEEIERVKPGITGGSARQKEARAQRAWNYFVSKLPQP